MNRKFRDRFVVEVCLIMIAAACGRGGDNQSWMSSQSNVQSDAPPLFDVSRGGKVGFIDRTGRVVVEPQFDAAHHFQEGMAIVKVGGKFGFIDGTGKIAINPQFDGVQDLGFHEGLAAVNVGGSNDKGSPVGGRWGFIDKTGAYVVKPTYEDADVFYEGLASVLVDGKWGFIDKTGNMVIGPRFPRDNISRDDSMGFHEGLLPYGVGDCGPLRECKWGYIDKTGKAVIEPVFKRAGAFSAGLAPVELEDGKYGYIDRTGKVVIPSQFLMARAFKAGLAEVDVGSDYGSSRSGLIDKTGKFVLNPKYSSVRVGEGVIVVRNCDPKCVTWLADRTGKSILDASGDYEMYMSGGLLQTKTGWFDPQTKKVLWPGGAH